MASVLHGFFKGVKSKLDPPFSPYKQTACDFIYVCKPEQNLRGSEIEILKISIWQIIKKHTGLI